MKINKSIISKVVLLALAVALVSVFYANNKKSQFTQLVNQETTKQYTNEEIGFSFEHPSSLTVFEWGNSDFEKYKELPQVIIVSVEDRELLTGGACGGTSPDVFDFEKKYLESNFVEREFLEENENFMTSGLHKVITTNSGENFLLTIRTCQGIAEDDEPAITSISADIFKENNRIGISLRDTEGFKPEVKVKDIQEVASQLMNGTYEGEMQNKLNQFVDIISTFEWN